MSRRAEMSRRSKAVLVLKRNRKYLETSTKVLEILRQARGGGIVSQVLASLSVAGELIDVLFPAPDPYLALKLEGLTGKSSAISEFVCSLLIEDGQGIPIASNMYSQAFVWRLGNKSKVGVLIYSGGYMSLYLDPVDGEQYLYELIKNLVWSRGKELELTKSKKEQQRGIPLLYPMSELGPYISKKEVDWYVKRLSLYPPGPRTVLFWGPTGIGKGVLSRHISRALKGKDALTLKISSDSLMNCDTNELVEIVKVLQPTVLMLDDLDLDNEEKTQMFLSLFEILRDPHCLVVATAMKTQVKEKDLKPGALYLSGMRPGRIDEIFLLRLPDQEERMLILTFYLVNSNFGQKNRTTLLTDKDLLSRVAKKTQGLSGAYLKAVVDRLLTHDLSTWEQEVDTLLYMAPAVEVDEDEKKNKKGKKKSKKTTDEAK